MEIVGVLIETYEDELVPEFHRLISITAAGELECLKSHSIVQLPQFSSVMHTLIRHVCCHSSLTFKREDLTFGWTVRSLNLAKTGTMKLGEL